MTDVRSERLGDGIEVDDDVVWPGVLLQVGRLA